MLNETTIECIVYSTQTNKQCTSKTTVECVVYSTQINKQIMLKQNNNRIKESIVDSTQTNTQTIL